ncbi:hypothetical protein DFH07DRAFT_1014420 [Mycena maculata]|uniref:Uncharacterized protein n=1 Tax=Mycena maculata TaxID=230809 RepID=A0AAD7NLG1_9AGAR|nr:hypothetical protein DFH07DRAFT_1014420 [Mycena maculata]
MRNITSFIVFTYLVAASTVLSAPIDGEEHDRRLVAKAGLNIEGRAAVPVKSPVPVKPSKTAAPVKPSTPAPVKSTPAPNKSTALAPVKSSTLAPVKSTIIQSSKAPGTAITSSAPPSKSVVVILGKCSCFTTLFYVKPSIEVIQYFRDLLNHGPGSVSLSITAFSGASAASSALIAASAPSGSSALVSSGVSSGSLSASTPASSGVSAASAPSGSSPPVSSGILSSGSLLSSISPSSEVSAASSVAISASASSAQSISASTTASSQSASASVSALPAPPTCDANCLAPEPDLLTDDFLADLDMPGEVAVNSNGTNTTTTAESRDLLSKRAARITSTNDGAGAFSRAVSAANPANLYEWRQTTASQNFDISPFPRTAPPPSGTRTNPSDYVAAAVYGNQCRDSDQELALVYCHTIINQVKEQVVANHNFGILTLETGFIGPSAYSSQLNALTDPVAIDARTKAQLILRATGALINYLNDNTVASKFKVTATAIRDKLETVQTGAGNTFATWLTTEVGEYQGRVTSKGALLAENYQFQATGRQDVGKDTGIPTFDPAQVGHPRFVAVDSEARTRIGHTPLATRVTTGL